MNPENLNLDPSLSLEPIEREAPAIEAIVGYARGLAITTDTEAEEAADIVSRIAAQRKQVGEARLAITRPLDQAKKAAIAQEKAVLEPLEAVDRELRAALGTWHAEQERKRREEAERTERLRREAEAKVRAEAKEAERKAREHERAAEQRKTEAARDRQAEAAAEEADRAELARAQAEMIQRAEAGPSKPTGPVRSDSGTASVRMVWTFEIVDPDAIPREFLVPDEKAIRRAVDGGAREIAGVKIEKVPQVGVRARPKS